MFPKQSLFLRAKRMAIRALHNRTVAIADERERRLTAQGHVTLSMIERHADGAHLHIITKPHPRTRTGR